MNSFSGYRTFGSSRSFLTCSARSSCSTFAVNVQLGALENRAHLVESDLENEHLISKSTSIQPRTSHLKFGKRSQLLSKCDKFGQTCLPTAARPTSSSAASRLCWKASSSARRSGRFRLVNCIFALSTGLQIRIWVELKI